MRTIIDGSLLFSSEVKALRGHEGHIPKIDETALAVRLAWEYPLDGTTLLKDVTQVRPGTVELWKLDDSGNAFYTQQPILSVRNLILVNLNPQMMQSICLIPLLKVSKSD